MLSAVLTGMTRLALLALVMIFATSQFEHAQARDTTVSHAGGR